MAVSCALSSCGREAAFSGFYHGFCGFDSGFESSSMLVSFERKIHQLGLACWRLQNVFYQLKPLDLVKNVEKLKKK